MITGCSNHGCAVKGDTGGMHTNSICNCVRRSRTSAGGCSIVVCDGRVGSEMNYVEGAIVMRWLTSGGGLRDILALERSKEVEG